MNVIGMTCSSCVSHVEKAVQKLEGVEKVEVNLLTNRMEVMYNDSTLRIEEIRKAVKDAGYEVVIPTKEIRQTRQQNNQEEIIKQMKTRVILSFAFLIPLMYLAMYHMLPNFLVPDIMIKIFHGENNAISNSLTQFLLLLPILYLNRSYFTKGFKMLWKRTPNMDSLISIGAVAATIYGIITMYQIGMSLALGKGSHVNHLMMDLYFESAGTILTLITLGKYLETKSKGKTSEAINRLLDLSPKTAIVIKDGKEIEVPVEEIRVGDYLRIKPGAAIPVDAIVLEGQAMVDQSMITGESIPVKKKIGDEVISATIIQSGYLKVEAKKVGEDTTISQIIKLVEQASASKAPIAKLADKISGIFVPVVISISLLAMIIWGFLGYPIDFILSIGISVLVISCPCALGLATPVSIMVATGKAAENGILLRNAESLEIAHHITTVVFDKTGTITKGKPYVTGEEISSNIDRQKFFCILASIEKDSEHPIAKAMLEKAKQEKIALLPTKNFTNLTGMGITAQIEEETYFIGNDKLMEEKNIAKEQWRQKMETFLLQGKTAIYVANEKEVLGIVAVSDPIKETSKIAIKKLKDQGLEVIMLTGDNQKTAETIRKEVGIDEVVAEVLPQDKESKIRNLQEQGKKVAMVGDGINDAPALVRANLGVAIGAGTDIAIESADIILMKSDLMDFVNAITLSKETIKNIKMNLFWAFFYNTIGIPIAAGVFYIPFAIKLNPMIAALAMSFSSVCVVLNALRLRNFRIPTTKQEMIEEEIKMEKIIKIKGMQCNHCKMSVEKALIGIDGVEECQVNLEKEEAIIVYKKEIPDEVISDTISEIGFEVIKK